MTGTMPARPSYKYVLLILAALFLLLGVGLFFYEKQDEVTLAIPVKLEHIPHDLIALRNTPLVLEARLKGPSRILKALTDSQVYYGIDLSEAKPGPLFINLSPEMVKAPRRVSVLEIDPVSISLTIDTRIEKSVPVVPDLNKDPAPGYIISRVVATPSTVRLTGPMRVLEKISAVRTTPVDVGELTETIKKKVALNLNHNSYVQAIGEHLVEVEIAVEQKIVEKWLDIAVQATGGNYYQYVITPDRVEILLRGPMNTLKNLAQDNGIQACVNLDGLGPGTYMRRAAIKPPLNTALLEARPEVFTVKVLESG
jgi:YbbR domain-containing protein